jgi:fructokinase
MPGRFIVTPMLTGSPIIFGEVLFDRFPDGNAVLGGAPFNVAWNLHAFGLSPLLVSRVGEDSLGRRILAAMAAWGMDCSAVQTDPNRPTGTVEIVVRDGEPTFTIATEQAYDHLEAAELPHPSAGSLIYHGSLALRGPNNRAAWDNWQDAGQAPCFMDVNLRAPFWNAEEVLTRARRATWVKLNSDELDLLVPGDEDPGTRARKLMAGSSLEGVILTRGEKGASLFSAGGGEQHPPAVPAARVKDTVGAGDAFSSVVILGLVRGWGWPQILPRALEFAAAVVGLQGATTDNPDFYLNFKRDWEHS